MKLKNFSFSDRRTFRIALLIVVLPLLCPPQLSSFSDSPTEQYKNVLRAISDENYAEAILLSRGLLERTSRYDHLYSRIAYIAKATGQMNLARRMFESLLQHPTSNPKGYYGLGLLSAQQEDYLSAVENYKKCLLAQPDFPLPLFGIVDAFKSMKQPAKAKDFLDSLPENNSSQYVNHLGLSYYYLKQGQYGEMVKQIDLAEMLNPKSPEVCYYKAMSRRNLRKDGEVPGVLDECLPRVEANMNEEQVQDFRLLKAASYLTMGNYNAGLNVFDQVLATARALRDTKYEEVCLAYIGLVQEMQDNYSQALICYRQALELASRNNGLYGIENLKKYPGRIGRIYFWLGDFEAATKQFQTGLRIARDVRDQWQEALMLTYIGDCFAAQNDLSSVVDYYKLAAEISERRPDILSQSFAHELLATVYRKLGDYAKAKASIQRGLDIARTGNIFELELTMMNGLGALHLKQNEIEQAIAIFSAAIQLAESKNSHREAWKARAGLAEAYKMSGRISQAHLQYQKAIEELENIRAQVMGDEEKGGFFHDKIKVYKDIVDVLMQLREKNEARHYEAEAFQYAERARARAFLELLVEGKIKLERDLAPDLLKRKQKIDAVISKLHSDLTKERLSEPANQNKATLERLEQERAQADADYADWLRELRQRDPQYARLKYPEPISLAQTQQLLDEQTVMLSYSLGETSSFLFVVSRDGFSPLWLNAPAQAVSREVEQILAAIKNRSMPEFRKLSVRLYERLIKPAESLLKGKRELVILADGALHRLPFEVLLPPSSRQITQPDARKLPYLVREHAISYAPSASVLAELQSYHKQAAPGQKVFLAFADPVYDAEAQGKDSVIALTTRSARGDDGQWKFNRLLYSKNEAEGIAKLFPDGQADIYQGAQATEENAKAPGRLEQYRILHFAAHGLINQSRPRFSGVVLTLPRNGSGGAEDGILQAYEIFNLKLNADLVVLSACETGLGKEVNGEGMMSLMRAFIYAGTPSVVASLWNVDDEKSAELMIRFYTHLKDGKHKSEALRQAQLDTIQKYGAPYFWAPFVLMGRAK